MLQLLGAGGVFLALFLGNGFHMIREGHLGLYWRGGKLLARQTEPGMHWKWPFMDSHAEIQTTIQTDSVSRIPCGTSGGVVIMFAKVEVVNRLRKEFARETVANYTVAYDKLWIFDKVHHEINQFCSKHTLQEVAISLFDQIDEQLVEALRSDCAVFAPGIEIIAVRVTKPSIPEHIQQEFEKREAATAGLKVAEQRRLVVEAEAATDARKKTIEAKRDAEVAEINSRMQVEKAKSEQQMALIRDEMHLAHEKALADAEAYAMERRASANKLLLTPEYLELKRYEHISANTKIYFGDKIPTAMVAPLPAAGAGL